MGCTFEVSRQEKSHIMACRARVIGSEIPVFRRGQIHPAGLQPARKVRENALSALELWPRRRAGSTASRAACSFS